ncbi:Crp/Fnr family transcriptional regulator [Phaeospirillum tilakii]|uniref:Crp/Fnr family transcriptional regulator n=1 Tax=Phaeospirillum tilakii TaxID=741673 RepID=A0ABW5CDK0_9PROT
MTRGGDGATERRDFARGTLIFREGDSGDTAYLVHRGTVRIFKTVGGRRVTLGLVRPFQVFGELALIDDAPRMAGALADDDVTVLVLPRAAIQAMIDQAPDGLRTLILSMMATMRVMGDDLAAARAALLDAGG